MGSYSSNNLGEGLMNLPIELRQKILYLLTPMERVRLRLVNKAMLDVVDASMSDVQEIKLYLQEFYKPYSEMIMTTINPYNGARKELWHMSAPSSLPFLLKWAGAQLKTLQLNIDACKSEEEDSPLKDLYRVFEALNSENACPKLKNLSLNVRESLWDSNEIILSDLLNYITKRQLEAKAADHPTPFLHSLSFISMGDLANYKTAEEESLYSDKGSKFLQELLDQCHGLKELDVDSLLVQKDLPIVALRYPTTLTHLKSEPLGKTPGDLSTIIENCPNLQIVYLEVGFPHDDENFRALSSLSDLHELELKGHPTEEEIAWMTAQCLAAFKDYPFGASISRPWPQLRSVTLACYKDKGDTYINYRLRLSGVNCSITSLHLTWCPRWCRTPYAPPVEQSFKALNSEDVCPNLMELNINSCELVFCIVDSLMMRGHRELQAQAERPDDCYEDLPTFPIPSSRVYGMLNDLLAYVTKRQSEVRLGKPFLRSLSFGKCGCRCRYWERFDSSYDDRDQSYDDRDQAYDELEQILTTVQQILDQCHGLELLIMESLKSETINPDLEEGKDLMKLVPLRFPATLKKLNGVSLN